MKFTLEPKSFADGLSTLTGIPARSAQPVLSGALIEAQANTLLSMVLAEAWWLVRYSLGVAQERTRW